MNFYQSMFFFPYHFQILGTRSSQRSTKIRRRNIRYQIQRREECKIQNIIVQYFLLNYCYMIQTFISEAYKRETIAYDKKNATIESTRVA